MASSNSNPSLEELDTDFIDLWIFGLVMARDPTPREVTVYLDQPSGSVEIIDGLFDDVESSSKQGPQPASKASIESLPRVKVSDPGLECSICLLEYEGESEAKKMPCGHLFHSGCIDEWLEIRGSCPVCRFRMPVEEETESEHYEGEGWRIRVVVVREDSGLDSDGEVTMRILVNEILFF